MATEMQLQKAQTKACEMGLLKKHEKEMTKELKMGQMIPFQMAILKKQLEGLGNC
jgi:hypothetical protein